MGQGRTQGTLSVNLNIFSLTSGTVSTAKHTLKWLFEGEPFTIEELEGGKTICPLMI